MKIEGTYDIRAPRERVYRVLTDPEVLRRCLPGCEQLDRVDEDSYTLTLRAGVGSIKGVFKGTIHLEDTNPPSHYRLVVEGKGQPGFVKGTGDFDLEEKDGVSTISYVGDAKLGGTLASVGQRMVQGSVKMMASQFFTAIGAEAQTGEDEPPPKHGFFRTALRWLSGWIRRLFG